MPATTTRPRVLLATMALLPQGEAGLVEALDAVGVEARWVVWSEASVDWAADLVVVRSTWDYHRRPADFLAWAHRVERISPLLNGAAAFTWNADKAYLLELADHVPVVPTSLLDEATLVPGLRAALAEHGTVVVKPRTGASGHGVVVCDRLADPGLATGPWVVQPRVDAVATRGETSVFVLDGRAVSQVEKRPAAGEIRVHEEHGGRSLAAPLGERTAGLAESAVRAAARILGARPACARVDMVVWDDVWVVSELELIEPGLYLDVEPVTARHFAEMVRAHLQPPPAPAR